jgi:hypothetical protein
LAFPIEKIVILASFAIPLVVRSAVLAERGAEEQKKKSASE